MQWHRLNLQVQNGRHTGDGDICRFSYTQIRYVVQTAIQGLCPPKCLTVSLNTAAAVWVHVVPQCLPSGLTDGAACWKHRRGWEEKKGRGRRVERGTLDAEPLLPAKILQCSLSGKAGLQPSKYSG